MDSLMIFKLRAASGHVKQEYIDKLNEEGYNVFTKESGDSLDVFIEEHLVIDIIGISSIIGEDIIVKLKDKVNYREYNELIIYDDYVE